MSAPLPGILAGLILPEIVGLLLAYAIYPSWRRLPDGRALWVLVAAGGGVGLTACLFFWGLVALGPALPATLALELGLLALAAGAAFWRARRRGTPADIPPDPRPAPPHGLYGRLLTGTFALALALSGLFSIAAFTYEPHGRWDAYAIWNLRARYLFGGGDQWRAGFDPALAWTHPDYPLLLPGSVARLWLYSGEATTLAPILVGGLFTVLTVGLLVAGVNALRGREAALWAGLMLVGTITFVQHGVYQYADVPLSSLILAAVVLLTAYLRRGEAGLLVLAGGMAGFAAWTKNEGLLFLLSSAAVLGVWSLRRGGLGQAGRELGGFLLGALPALLTVLLFKLTLAPPNDLVSGQGAETAALLTDPARLLSIITAFIDGILGLGVGTPLVLAIYSALVGGRHFRAEYRVPIAILGGVLAGYVLVYLTTPHDLAWHLETSLERLLVHLWPAALFLFFLIVPPPAEAWRARRGAASRAAARFS